MHFIVYTFKNCFGIASPAVKSSIYTYQWDTFFEKFKCTKGHNLEIIINLFLEQMHRDQEFWFIIHQLIDSRWSCVFCLVCLFVCSLLFHFTECFKLSKASLSLSENYLALPFTHTVRNRPESSRMANLRCMPPEGTISLWGVSWNPPASLEWLWQYLPV